MDTTTLLAALEADGVRLAAAAGHAGHDTAVPGLTWTVHDLLVHTGAVHRWATDIVRRRLRKNETGGSGAFHTERRGDDLLDWYAAGLADLLGTLDEAPDDLAVWTFAPGTPARAFWCRRQAHETAVHRVDAEAAAGVVSAPIAPAFAQDGLAELLGFARERRFASPHPGRLALLATDGDDWSVTFGGVRNVTARAGDAEPVAGADATVSGSSAELYRWAWNRGSTAVEAGDPAVIEQWRAVRIS